MILVFTLFVNCFLLGICEKSSVFSILKRWEILTKPTILYITNVWYDCSPKKAYGEPFQKSLYFSRKESVYSFPSFMVTIYCMCMVGVMNFMKICNIFLGSREKQEVIAWYMIVEVWCIIIALPLYYLGFTMSIRILSRHDL